MNTLETTPLKKEVQLSYTPTEITQGSVEGTNIASFDYYSGIKYCNTLKIPQTTNMNEVLAGTHFIVCCGDVMVKVLPTDYPTIERRIF